MEMEFGLLCFGVRSRFATLMSGVGIMTDISCSSLVHFIEKTLWTLEVLN